MTAPLTIAIVALLLSAFVAMGAQRIEGDESPLKTSVLGIETSSIAGDQLVVNGQDHDGESGYRISGHVAYVANDGGPSEALLDRRTFSQELRANTTDYLLPRPDDERNLSTIAMEVRLEALDGAGLVLESDGFAVMAVGNNGGSPRRLS
ncbi:MAG: hypothetical protein WEE64_04230 [Dehalococcoidia bacterium]